MFLKKRTQNVFVFHLEKKKKGKNRHALGKLPKTYCMHFWGVHKGGGAGMCCEAL